MRRLKIRIKGRNLSGYRPGSVLTLYADVAQKWVDAGWAEFLEDESREEEPRASKRRSRQRDSGAG